MHKPWMNHKFSKESENALLKFLKTAKSHESNSFCDINKYEIWNRFIAVDVDLKQKLNEHIEVIDLTEKELPEDSNSSRNESTHIIVESLQTTTCEDITASIKEHLQSSDQITEQLFREMQKFSLETIRRIFTTLSEELNTKQIIIFGESIEQHFKNDLVTQCFCDCILIKRMLSIFAEDIKLYFLQLCERFNKIVRKQVVDSISNNDQLDILLLYLSSMQPSMQEEIIRDLLKDHEYFPKKYLLVFDCLLHEGIEYDCLKELVEIMANNAEHYITDKEYGKLLIKVAQYLGTNLTRLKTPFRHILATHKSVWKAKLQKICNTHFEKSLYFESQIIE